MAFIEVQFPTDISYGSAGGPEYATDVVASSSEIGRASCRERVCLAV